MMARVLDEKATMTITIEDYVNMMEDNISSMYTRRAIACGVEREKLMYIANIYPVKLKEDGNELDSSCDCIPNMPDYTNIKL